MYIPDSWVKLRVEREGEPTEYKILGGTSGGYLDGDSWRINSGVERESRGEDENGVMFTDYYGYSGSVYRCYDANNVIRMSIAGVLKTILEKGKGITMEELL